MSYCGVLGGEVRGTHDDSGDGGLALHPDFKKIIEQKDDRIEETEKAQTYKHNKAKLGDISVTTKVSVNHLQTVIRHTSYNIQHTTCNKQKHVCM